MFRTFILIVAILFSVRSFGLCVSKYKANLRKGPSTRYPITWEVGKYMPLRKIKNRGKWIRVSDVDGDKHWIHADLVTRKYLCAVIKKRKVNIRKGPGSHYASKYKAEKYETFKVVKTRGKWAKIWDEYIGNAWVFRKLVWIY